jgi:hypothetical protein
LNIKRNTLSGWKTRNSIDYDLVIDFCEQHNLDKTQILFGYPAMEASERRIREELGLEAGGPEAPLAWAAGPGAPGGAPQELAAARREIELLRALLADKEEIIRLLKEARAGDTEV